MDDAPAGHRVPEPKRCSAEQAPPNKLKEASELLSSAPSAASAAAEARPGHRAEEPSGCLAGKQSATLSKLKEAKEARPGHPFAPWQLGLMQGGAEPVRVARAWHGSGLLTVPSCNCAGLRSDRALLAVAAAPRAAASGHGRGRGASWIQEGGLVATVNNKRSLVDHTQQAQAASSSLTLGSSCRTCSGVAGASSLTQPSCFASARLA